MKTILQQLKEIEKVKCIYNIHYCKAGIGFVFYYQEEDKTHPTKRWSVDAANNGLSVDKYYPDFKAAVRVEYKTIKIK